MKRASGFLAMDGTFFHTEREAIRYETESSIRRYCDSQQPPLDYEALIQIINDIPQLIKVYIDGTPLPEEVSEGRDSDGAAEFYEEQREQWTRDIGYSGEGQFVLEETDEDDEEIVRARRIKERLLNGTASDANGLDTDAGKADAELGNDLSSYLAAGEPVSQPVINPANHRQRARAASAAQQQPLRRPVPLSNVGGGPLPKTVPDES